MGQMKFNIISAFSTHSRPRGGLRKSFFFKNTEWRRRSGIEKTLLDVFVTICSIPWN